MGYTEEAKINLATAREKGADAAQIALIQATLAVVEAVEGLSSQVAYLSDVTEGKNTTD